MDIKAIVKEAQTGMGKAVQHTLHEFTNLHTGKATPAMIENISVYIESYGSSMAIRELAAITAPDNRTLSIQPWDRSSASPIEKAIQTAGLGLNPINRGAAILIPIPELSGDRRREMAKIAAGHAEDGRVSVRKIRQNAMDELKKLKSSVSEDDIKRTEKDIQTETDKHIEQINTALKAKEKELTTV